MWLFAMFDLPVTTKLHRKQYARFRSALLSEGLMRLQYSIYAVHCDTEVNGERMRQRLQRHLPPEGQVRLLMVTDRQFAKMLVFFGKKQVATEESPEQLMLF